MTGLTPVIPITAAVQGFLMDDDIREALAAHKREIESLNGELFAIRALLFYFLARSQTRAPDPIRLAFDDAANHIEHAAIGAGKGASPEHLVKALGIVEDLRSKIFGNAHR